MFQSFDVVSDPAQGVERVDRLRRLLEERELDCFIVPRADEHQGEYVPARAERLRWLTGFSGSAGVAVILRDEALIFVDGRYTLQVREQTDPAVFSSESLVENPPRKWMEKNLSKGMRIGFDPWLHTIGEAKGLRRAAEKCGAELVAVEENPVDAIWEDQPALPVEPARIHPLRFAGEEAKDKLAALGRDVGENGATCTVLTDPSSLAWAFNIRGNDVPHTPLVLGFAIIFAEGRPQVFLDKRKLDTKTEAYLTQLADVRSRSELEDALVDVARSGAKVGLDPALAAEKLRLLVENSGGAVVEMPDPTRLPRATKNAVELGGARDAHRRDGAAVCRFLCWLDAQPANTLDEIKAAMKLEELRRQAGEAMQMPLKDISFDTISGAGPNGAVIHYRVTTKSARRFAEGEFYLVDSGAQYEDGTTDITRTVAVGSPTDEMRQRYTLVLKGTIGISLLRFPPGTRGMDLDPVARLALWKHGLDFAHGTGHGVGSYLSVHEGPQRLARTGTEKLRAGMILSNEPGYYKEGGYGVRLENLVVVTPPEPIEGGDIDMHGFETLTLAPFDRRAIVPELLTDEERAWLDAYHRRVAEEIGPLVDGETLGWLEQATAPL